MKPQRNTKNIQKLLKKKNNSDTKTAASISEELLLEILSFNYKLDQKHLKEYISKPSVKYDNDDMLKSFMGFRVKCKQIINTGYDITIPLGPMNQAEETNSKSLKIQSQDTTTALKQRKELHAINRSLIKAKPIDTAEKVLALSTNKVEGDILKQEEKLKNAKKLSLIGLAATFLLPPVGIFILGLGLLRLRSAEEQKEFYINWKNRIQYIYQQELPNTMINIECDNQFGQRPWIHYTTDGKNWIQEPLAYQGGNYWQAGVHIEKVAKYTFFLGPGDQHCPNPLQQLKAWKAGDNLSLNSEQQKIKFTSDRNGMMQSENNRINWNYV